MSEREEYVTEGVIVLAALSAAALSAIVAKQVKTVSDKTEMHKVINDYKIAHPEIIKLSDCTITNLSPKNVEKFKFTKKEQDEYLNEHGCHASLYEYKDKAVAKVVINILPSGAGQLLITLLDPVFKKYKDYYQFTLFHDTRNVIGGCFISPEDKQLMKKLREEIDKAKEKESKTMKEYVEKIDDLFESFMDGDINEEQFYHEMVDCVANRFGVQPITEGANHDYKAVFKACKKELKSSMKDLKKMAKKGDPKDKAAVEAAVKKCKKAVKDAQKEIKSIPSSVPSTIISFLVIWIVDILKWTIPILITFGLAGVVYEVKRLIEFFGGIIKGVNGEEAWADALNQVKQRYELALQFVDQSITSAERTYKLNVKTNKATATKESVNIKLDIYEACMSGKISEKERDNLLNEINSKLEA